MATGSICSTRTAAARGIQSLDTRAAGLVEEWSGNGVADAADAHLPAKAMAGADAGAAAWMTQHRPETYGAARRTVLMCKDC